MTSPGEPPVASLGIREKHAHVAATMAFGKRSAVSGRPAVVLGGLLDDDGRAIQVTTASHNSGWHDGVRVRESRRLTARDVTRAQGIAVVCLEWAIVDVAGSGGDADFTELFNAVDRKRLVDPLLLAGQLRRGRRGSARVRARLAAYTEHPLTESELEDLFVALVLVPYAIPPPVPQASPLPHRAQRVDFTWPEQRVRRGDRQPGVARRPGRLGRGPRPRHRPAPRRVDAAALHPAQRASSGSFIAWVSGAFLYGLTLSASVSSSW